MTEARQPRFCGHCGEALPPSGARFCIECGRPVPGAAESSAGVPTVQLVNARVEQMVIGGTMKLPSSGAMPPGLWLAPDPPGPEDVVAIYAPLRAIVGGWSGLIGAGWRPHETEPTAARGPTTVYRFVTERDWFPATGGARGLRLRVRVLAEAAADEGRSRRGFRYQVAHDPPMQVVASWWLDPSSGARVGLDSPQVQLMAPPRVPRVSDFKEAIEQLPAPEAHRWALAGREHGVFRLLSASQQRTPAGRGLPLAEIRRGWSLGRIFGRPEPRYRVQFHRPLACHWAEWRRWLRTIRAEAAELGLDFEADSSVEWWLDRQGYDGVVFDGASQLYGHERVAIAFRRAQIARVGDG